MEWWQTTYVYFLRKIWHNLITNFLLGSKRYGGLNRREKWENGGMSLL